MIKFKEYCKRIKEKLTQLIKWSVIIGMMSFIFQEVSSTIINHMAEGWIEDKEPPSNTETSIFVNKNHPENKLKDMECITSELWKVNNQNGMLPVIFNNNPSVMIRVVNNNSKLMYINNIWVNVEEYSPIEKVNDKHIQTGLGDIARPVNITSKLESKEGKYIVETKDKDIDVKYVKIAPDDMEIFILDFGFDKEGVYDISVEFEYGYKDKEYTEVTDRQKIVCIYQ